MNSMRRVTDISGIRFWRQDHPHTIPRFEVWEVFGHSSETGHYYFKNRGCSAIIARSTYQLDVRGFHPFLITRSE